MKQGRWKWLRTVLTEGIACAQREAKGSNFQDWKVEWLEGLAKDYVGKVIQRNSQFFGKGNHKRFLK